MFEHEMEESKKVSPKAQSIFIPRNKLVLFVGGSAGHFFLCCVEGLESLKDCVLSNGCLLKPNDSAPEMKLSCRT